MQSTNTIEESGSSIHAAHVVLACDHLQPTLEFFVDKLRFRVDYISPADNPRTARISGHGLSLELRLGGDATPVTLHLTCDDPEELGGTDCIVHAPNGTRIELSSTETVLAIPAVREEFVVTRLAGGDDWITGRAGMQYRDLIPGRLGGRFIASHIRIPDGGPVPDHVHHHRIRFQMIYCARGWVRVVYEDQGPPITLAAGDCVLQPPHIRHRVLESSAGLEVIELASPAEHDTLVDHALELPTKEIRPDREFGGQRFVFHVAATASWQPWSMQGFESRDTGIARASAGIACAKVVRAASAELPSKALKHSGELLFFYILAGWLKIDGLSNEQLELNSGDNAVIPSGIEYLIADCSDDLEFLEVRITEHKNELA